MNAAAKQAIAVGASVVIVIAGVVGNYLPLRKAQRYIEGTRSAQQSARTIQEFEQFLSDGLDAPSPIGRPELVRQAATIVLSIVRQNGGRAEVISALRDYIMGYYEPLLRRGKGMSFSQDLYITGLVNQTAFVQTKNPAYFTAAEALYREGNRRAPLRPQFLYGLFDLARHAGDRAAVGRIGGEILRIWPDDRTIRQELERLGITPGASPAPQ